MSHSRFVVPLVVAILVSSAYGHASVPCVETFDEFEKAVLANPDNVQALVREFYTPNQPIPLSVHVVYHIKLSNGRDTIFSTDPRCPAGKEMWLWVPSPVFIFMEPSKLNLCAFRTLNFFKLWTPRKAHIYVPIVCNSTNRFNFLNELTSRVCMCGIHTFSVSSVLREDIHGAALEHLSNCKVLGRIVYTIVNCTVLTIIP